MMIVIMEKMMNELAVMNFSDIMTLGQQMAQSAYFKDGEGRDRKPITAAQAAVKIQAGYELGLTPFASIANVHIIQGKPTLGATMVGALIRRHPRYDYEVSETGDTGCVIEWFSCGATRKPMGQSKFDMKDAKRAGLLERANSPWTKYPSDMCFARALTQGARRYCPDVFGGMPIYDKEELTSIEDTAPAPRAAKEAPSPKADPDIIDVESVEIKPDNKDIIKKHREAVVAIMNHEGLVSKEDIGNCSLHLKTVGIDLKGDIISIFNDDVTQSSMIRYIKEYAEQLKMFKGEIEEVDKDVDM